MFDSRRWPRRWQDSKSLPPHILLKEFHLSTPFRFQGKPGGGQGQRKARGRNPVSPSPNLLQRNHSRPGPNVPSPQRKTARNTIRPRSQTPERRAYRRRYAQQKRERQKSLGLCRDCSNPAIPGQTRCTTCADKHREYKRRSNATRRNMPEDTEPTIKGLAGSNTT